jgi:hypothetical protein
MNFEMNFGFIITRHVNSEITNKYWNTCIQCIRHFYPLQKIIVIDDNSKKEYLQAEYEYKNVEYINSEFPGRGELLPYYYFYKNHFFDNAIILHDSAFIQKKINFDYLVKKQTNVLPLWHFTCEKKENFHMTAFLMNKLTNNGVLINTLLHDAKYEILSGCNQNSQIWSGCFGVQSFINRNFLHYLQNKYNMFSMLFYVKKRSDRCCLERIMGIIFYTEYLKKIQHHSLFGDIKKYCKWGYTYQEHIENLRNKKIIALPIVKVWSGR